MLAGVHAVLDLLPAGGRAMQSPLSASKPMTCHQAETSQVLSRPLTGAVDTLGVPVYKGASCTPPPPASKGSAFDLTTGESQRDSRWGGVYDGGSCDVP